ncbi:MAG: 3-hydroxyacyl-CoA dehydrogenase NAD-binding domain-containing protein [Propionibacteriaceae bacterium]|nr:3-hydroxyacyl-CoA dehydrogenase NAD-binding domain-containing protein [Propionibacteriaceae bacterium]
MTENMKVAVIGQGTMGAGITEVFAKAGFEVHAVDNNEAALERGRSIVSKSTGRAVSKGRMSEEDQAALLGRITYSTDPAEAAAGCGLIIEAVFEDLGIKQDIFKKIDTTAPEDAILATNTSSLAITAIAAAVSRPERVVGVHFFNPAPVQTLVEVIRTVYTDDAVVEKLVELLKGLRKSPVVVNDRAGFIVNSLLVPYIGSAIHLYENGFATREEIDTAMVKEAGYPMGPLALADMIGNDVCLAVLDKLYDETKNRVNAPAPILSRLVTANMQGMKTGKGFYTYVNGKVADDRGPIRRPLQTRKAELPDRLVGEYLNNCVKMVEENYASVDAVNTGMAEGCRMPKPFEVLKEMGPKRVLEIVEGIYAETGEPGHRPARLLRQLAEADDANAALDELQASTAELHAANPRG